MQGTCLCGHVKFQLSLNSIKIYQCYCSLCQKQSGTASNLATIVPEAALKFNAGSEQHITTWVKDSGFTSHFCKTCGAPVPNKLRTYPHYWVPVGLLDDLSDATVVSHIYAESQPNICIADDIETFGAFPTGGIAAHIQKISEV